MKIDFSSLGGGAVGERVNIELQKVAANIADPNTEWKKAREVTIKIKLVPDENRDIALVSVDVTPKLAPARAIPTKIVIGKDNSGRVVAAELKSGVKDQTYFDDEGKIRDDKGYEMPSNDKVVGFNKIQGGTK